MRTNLKSLDSLRGLLAVYVLFGHARWLLWVGHSAWLRLPHNAWQTPLVYASSALRFGHEAVMVFFVLSGFFIHLRAAEQLAGEGVPNLSATRFYRRRAHRLVAPYLFALLITFSLDTVGHSQFPRLYAAATGDQLVDQTIARGGYRAQSVLPALALLPSTLGYDFGTNGPLWSIAYEVVYYALYPFWLALRTRSAIVGFGVVPLACLSVTLLHVDSGLLLVLLHYPVWLAGAGIAEWLVHRRLNVSSFVVPSALFLGGMTMHLLSPAGPLQVGAAVVFGSAAVLGFAALPEVISTSRFFAMAAYLGVRSYTIYMVHFPVLALLSAWVIQTRGARPDDGWLALAGGILAVAFGCLCFAICERHFLHARLDLKTTGQ